MRQVLHVAEQALAIPMLMWGVVLGIHVVGVLNIESNWFALLLGWHSAFYVYALTELAKENRRR